jgi:hypothetical protein
VQFLQEIQLTAAIQFFQQLPQLAVELVVLLTQL